MNIQCLVYIAFLLSYEHTGILLDPTEEDQLLNCKAIFFIKAIRNEN